MGKNTKAKAKANSRKSYIIPVVIVGAILAIYLVFSLIFSNRFCFGTTVNGINASMMSPKSMEKRIGEAAKDYEINIESNGSVVDSIRGEAIGLKSNPENGEVEEFLASQNGFAWPSKLFKKDEFVGKRLVTFDDASLQKEVSSLSCVTTKDYTPTEDATFEFSGDKFKIVDEVYGTEIEEKSFAKKIGDNIRLLHSSVDLEKDELYKQPEIKNDDKELKATVDELNNMLGTTITYKEGSKITGKEIASWIKSDPDSQDKFTFDEDAIGEYVDGLAKKYNTAGKPKELVTSYGNTVTVPGGNYGWKVDTEGEVNQIIDDIKAKKDVNRELVYQYKANSHDDKDYGNSYVEVNLSAQHLFLYVNGTRVLDTPFVSGNLSRGNGTHTGAFRIAYCQRNAVLRGDNYATPVSYWMPFNMGEGLHDATWRSSFGGNIFRTSGSHGCVNLPYSAAAKIFEKVSAGFPVLVYSTGGTENTGTAVTIPNNQNPAANQQTGSQAANAGTSTPATPPAPVTPSTEPVPAPAPATPVTPPAEPAPAPAPVIPPAEGEAPQAM